MKFIDEEKEKNNKKNNKLLKKIFIFIHIINLLFASYSLERAVSPTLTPSPYEGSEIDIDLDKLDKEVIKFSQVIEKSMSEEEIIKYVKNNMSMDEKKNRLLLSALNKNLYYTKEDQIRFAGYLQYLNDNPYIDYESVYKIFRSSILLKNINLKNASGSYSAVNNIIKLEDYAALGHEAFHMDDIYLHNYMKGENSGYDFQDWFIEGFSEVLSSEYIDFKNDSYPVECAAIRIFTEFLGADKMLEVRSKGNFEIFVSAVIEKGVDKEELLDLLDVLNQYTKEYKKNCTTVEELEERRINCNYLASIICEKFITLYNEIYNTPEYVSPTFVYNIEKLVNQELNDFNKFHYYLFNKIKLEKEPYPYMMSDYEASTRRSDGSIENIIVTVKKEYHQDGIHNYHGSKLSLCEFYTQETLQKFLLEEKQKIK